MVHLFAGEDVVGGHLEACGEQAHCVAVLTLSLNKCAICKRVTHCLCTYVSLWMTASVAVGVMKMGQDSASLLSVSHHCTSNCMLVVHWHSSQVSGSAWVLILILTTPRVPATSDHSSSFIQHLFVLLSLNLTYQN